MNARFYLAARKTAFFLLSFQFLFSSVNAQTRYAGSAADLTVNGTSTLHNWSMKSAKADCTAQFDFAPGGTIAGLQSLIFSTPVNFLKSEHSSMDNNAYKALKTDKNPTIAFTMSSVLVTPAEGGASTVKCTGKLTIAGVTKDVQLTALCKPNADNTITVTGSQTISMSDFKIDPPTFMMGTIKTGNNVTLVYSMILKKA